MEQISALTISPEAAVLEINGRSVASLDEAVREWRRARSPRTLYLDQGGVRFFSVLADSK
jgi:hypothetical protein